MSAVMKAERALPVESNATPLLQAITKAASDPTVDIDKMERLMQMHDRIVAREAEGAFNSAMRDCQAEMRPIAADAENKQTSSKYATHGKLDGALRPIYTKHGFSISYDEGDSPKPEHVRVLAYVSHIAGHTRTYHKDMPADGKGAKGGDVMTKTHASGAADSYGKRYLLKNIWNVAIGEEDKDGNDPPKLPAADFERFKKAIQATTTKEKAKEKWHEGVKACEKVGDREAAEDLKTVLLDHCKFIDEAAKAQ
jgi:hypothetical protein